MTLPQVKLLHTPLNIQRLFEVAVVMLKKNAASSVTCGEDLHVTFVPVTRSMMVD